MQRRNFLKRMVGGVAAMVALPAFPIFNEAQSPAVPSPDDLVVVTLDVNDLRCDRGYGEQYVPGLIQLLYHSHFSTARTSDGRTVVIKNRDSTPEPGTGRRVNDVFVSVTHHIPRRSVKYLREYIAYLGKMRIDRGHPGWSAQQKSAYEQLSKYV